MGRKKINIAPIEHASTRRATFEKRRIGLLKKAIELSILCKSTLSLTIYTDEGDVYIYSSEPYENVVRKWNNYRGSYRLLTNDHLPELIPGKSESNSVGFEIIKQPNINNNNINNNININNNNNQDQKQRMMVMPLIESYSNASNTSSSTSMDPPSTSTSSSSLSMTTMGAINQLDVNNVYNLNHQYQNQNVSRKRKWNEMTPEFDLPLFREGSIEFDQDLSTNMQNNIFLNN